MMSGSESLAVTPRLPPRKREENLAAAMNCPKCASPNERGDRFCRICGGALERRAVSARAQAAAPSEGDATSRGLMPITVSTVALLVLIAACIYWWSSRSGAPFTPSASAMVNDAAPLPTGEIVPVPLPGPHIIPELATAPRGASRSSAAPSVDPSPSDAGDDAAAAGAGADQGAEVPLYEARRKRQAAIRLEKEKLAAAAAQLEQQHRDAEEQEQLAATAERQRVELAARQAAVARDAAARPAAVTLARVPCADSGNFFTREICLYRECAKPEFGQAPLCQRFIKPKSN
jgi:hypothetical protein